MIPFFKKAILTFSFSFLAVANISSTTFDEGMFPLSKLSNLDLSKHGLLINQKEIYNPDSISLIDALVKIGGCTGSFVSDKGLIITNHHCAFSAVQQASTSKNDYLTKSFVANSIEQEIEAKGLSCRITESYEDVSEEILNSVSEILDPQQRLILIKEKIKVIETRAENEDPTIEAEVSEMFTGKSYVLFKYKIIKDVRLVYVPQRNIGEFGGETDNWVWPRHTGDFSFLRAYVAKDGSAATYSKENIPYQPKKYLKISNTGAQNGDFTFMLGYPGRTFRHFPAQFIAYQQNYQLPYVSEMYAYQNNIMKKIGKAQGRDTELALETRIKRNANTLKNYQGKLKGLNLTNLLKQKQEEDQNIAQFINENAELKMKYGNLIDQLDQLYRQINSDVYRDLWFSQIYGASSLLKIAAAINNFKQQLISQPIDKRENFYSVHAGKLENNLQNIYQNFNIDVDRMLFYNMLERASKLPLNQKISIIDKKIKGFNTAEQIDQYINNLFQYSRLKDQTYIINNLFKDSKFILSYQDEILKLEEDLRKQILSYQYENNKLEASLNKLLADYVNVKELYLNTEFVPDANSTLRLTYGHIKGYSPVKGVFMLPFTSIEGMLEKGQIQNPDYFYPPKVKDLWLQKDFGPFASDSLKDVPVCFLYDMDTTSGNSGSPVLNAYGELIGINFDRTYEATINDYAWNENYSRSIGVDIRYILWVATKVDHADGIIQELGIGVF